MLAVGSLFLARYRVERKLGETELLRSYLLRDVLGGQRALLYLYPQGERAPLDLSSLAYRQFRARELCGERAAACRLGQRDGAAYALLDLPPAAGPLDPPPADAVEGLLAILLRDLLAGRAEGLPFTQVSPDLIWSDGRGGLLYLPPLTLHFPGFLDAEAAGLDPSPALRAGLDLDQEADLHGFARVVERWTPESRTWADFRTQQLPRALAADPAERPTARAMLAASPLAGDAALAELAAAADGLALRLVPPLAARAEALLRAFRAGEDLWLAAEGPGARRLLRALVLYFGRAGEERGEAAEQPWARSGESSREAGGALRCVDRLDAPTLLLDRLWSSPGAGRLLVLAGEEREPGSGELDARVEQLLAEWPRLNRQCIAAESASPASGEGTLGQLADSLPLLELLALQDEALSLGLLTRLFDEGEPACFARVAALDRRGLLAWRPGLDAATGRWGLRIELADPDLQRSLQERLAPDRRQELQRLCVGLFAAPERAGFGKPPAARAALLRLHHLRGAEDWTSLAGESLMLFRWAEREGHPLLLAHLVDLMCDPRVERRLGVEGLRRIYLHLGRSLVQRGDLDAATRAYQVGLRALTGREDFLDRLLAPGSAAVPLPTATAPELLPAVSILVRQLAEIGETRGEFAWAISILGRLLDVYSEALSGYERGLLLNELAWLHYRKGEHERAVERCEVALRLFDPTAHQAELGQTYNTLGAAQWALNRWQEAEAYYKRALALRERAGDENRVAASLNNLGNLYRLTERFALAIDYFNRSMAIKKRLKNYPGYLISLYNVALISFELNDLPAARAHCRECLELNLVVGNIQLGAEVEGLLGEIEQVEGHPEAALAHLQSAVGTCRDIEAHTELATMFRRLIPVQLALGDLAGAQATIEEGLASVWRINNRLEEARIQAAAAEVHLAGAARPQALAALEKAADLYGELDRYEMLARVYSASACNWRRTSSNGAR